MHWIDAPLAAGHGEVMSRRLDVEEITRQLADLPGWQLLAGTLHARYRAPDFPAAVRLLDEVADVAQQMDHHPDVDLRFRVVRFALSTHSAGGVTQLDVELAHRIAEHARMLGAELVDVVPQATQIAVDAVDRDAVAAVWQAAFAYKPGRDEDGDLYLEDPQGLGPSIWFQQMEPPRTGRNRLHIDVNVPAAEAPGRVDAVLAAGGRLVTDEFAPSWWVLADPEGNELCVCTPGAEASGGEAAR
jgi:4a-hydroxytetrahydrobiopterin dehydratase